MSADVTVELHEHLSGAEGGGLGGLPGGANPPQALGVLALLKLEKDVRLCEKGQRGKMSTYALVLLEHPVVGGVDDASGAGARAGSGAGGGSGVGQGQARHQGQEGQEAEHFVTGE